MSRFTAILRERLERHDDPRDDVDQQAEAPGEDRQQHEGDPHQHRVDVEVDADPRRIHPSGISIQFDSYIILAGKERLIVQVSKEGEIVSSAKLKKKYHRQSEGIGFLPDHTLVISDEGRYRGGRVTTYKLGL